MSLGLIISIVAVVALSLGVLVGKQRRFSFKKVVLVLLVIVLILAFAGVEPLAGYKDAAVSHVNRWIGGVEGIVGTAINSVARPIGTYTVTVLGMEETITFSGDTLTVYSSFSGKRVFKYRFVQRNDALRTVCATEATGIWVNNVVTGESRVLDFKYIAGEDVVVFAKVSFWKR